MAGRTHGGARRAEASLTAVATAAAAPAATLPGDRMRGFAAALLMGLPPMFLVSRAWGDGIVIVIAVMFLVRSYRYRSWRWLQTPWVTVGCLLWLYFIVASLIVLPPADSLARPLPFIRFVVFAAALQHWLLPDRDVRRGLLAALGVTVAFVSIDCLVQFATGRSLTGQVMLQSFRLTGPFPDNRPGSFLAKTAFPLLAPLLAWACLSSRHVNRLVPLLALAVMGGVILVTGERMALLTYTISLVLLMAALPRLRMAMLGAGVAFALAGGGVMLVDPVVFDRTFNQTKADVDDFWQERYGQIFRTAIGMWRTSPLLGVGIKQYRVHCADPALADIGPLDRRCYPHPHNPYLEYLSETGLIGLSGFLVLIAAWFKEMWPAFRGPEPTRTVVIVTAAGLLAFLWPVMSSMSIFTNWNAVLFWLNAGWALALARPRPV